MYPVLGSFYHISSYLVSTGIQSVSQIMLKIKLLPQDFSEVCTAAKC